MLLRTRETVLLRPPEPGTSDTNQTTLLGVGMACNVSRVERSKVAWMMQRMLKDWPRVTMKCTSLSLGSAGNVWQPLPPRPIGKLLRVARAIKLASKAERYNRISQRDPPWSIQFMVDAG